MSTLNNGQWVMAGLLITVMAGCDGTTGPAALRTVCAWNTEFPPSACARLVGRALSPEGTPIANLGIRVDSFIPGQGYQFASNAVLTDGGGRFTLDVHRDLPPNSPLTSAMAGVELKVRRAVLLIPGDDGEATALVNLQFAPYGLKYVTTSVNVTIRLP